MATLICKGCGETCCGCPVEKFACPQCGGYDLIDAEEVRDEPRLLKEVIEPHVRKILAVYKAAHGMEGEPLDGDETELLSNIVHEVMDKNEGNAAEDALPSSAVEKIVRSFEDVRIPEEKREKGLYYYECRHSENDWSIPMTIELAVGVNFWGTIATKEPLDFKDILDGDRYIELSEEDGDHIQKLSAQKYSCAPECVHEHCCTGSDCKRDDKTGEYLPHDCRKEV